jgi:quercetin dioxygenase-like cupin family protein
MVTGGKLVNEGRDGTNRHGTAIEGGSARNIAKGDFLIIPINTPHWLSVINGTLVLISIHIPKS